MSGDAKNNDRVEVWNRLQEAINTAPIYEIQERILRDLEGDNALGNADQTSLRDAVSDAFALASLGKREAIEELAYVGNQIARFLADLSAPSQPAVVPMKKQSEGTETTEVGHSANAQAWFEQVNMAVESLLKMNSTKLRDTFGKVVTENLPHADFIFPVSALSKARFNPYKKGSSAKSVGELRLWEFSKRMEKSDL